MNDALDVEARLESLGAVLQARPRLTPAVMERVRAAASELPVAEPVVLSPRPTIWGRSRLLAASLATTLAIGAALLLAISLFPASSVGWSEVTEAMQSQPWIHGKGTGGAEMWLAPGKQVWAFVLPGASYFSDGRDKVRYEFRERDGTITKLPLAEADAQQILPTADLADDRKAIGPWLLGTEKIVDQQRREVTEDGKTWIEFDLVMWRGDMNHATLRVDPRTRLPVYLLSRSPDDPRKTSKWVFDYPASGPEDIYALGVPRDAKIVDRMPPGDAMQVLEAMAACRARIGDFQLAVGRESPKQVDAMVYRKGSKWRVETSNRPWLVVPENAAPPAVRVPPQIEAAQRLLTPLYVCDGARVWENASVLPGEAPSWQPSQHVAPQDLMSGEGMGMLPRAPGVKFAALVYPDLAPRPGWGFEFDAHPAEAPGCVLLKRSVGVTWPKDWIAHEWYYVDPAKGYAVVRAELFSIPPDGSTKPEDNAFRQTIVMTDFHKSPQGFWYPGVIDDTTPVGSPDAQPDLNAVTRHKTTTHYTFDFEAELPDSLFEAPRP